MADHLRQQIHAALVSAVNGLATTGARVYVDRDTEARPLDAAVSELPGLVLPDAGDNAETVTIGLSGIMERRLRVPIAAHVKAQSSPGATLNQILKELEVALAAASLAGAKSCFLVDVAEREISEVAETRTARQVFTFEIVYYTARGVPDTAL